MRQWLVDLNISGKSVAFLGIKGYEGSQLTFNRQAIDGQLKVTFEQSIALERLIGMPSQMLIALTSDLTDSEAESVSISMVPHAPPLRLSPTNYCTFCLPSSLALRKKLGRKICGHRSFSHLQLCQAKLKLHLYF